MNKFILILTALVITLGPSGGASARELARCVFNYPKHAEDISTEPSKREFARNRHSVKIYHIYINRRNGKEIEGLTCRVHLDCFIPRRTIKHRFQLARASRQKPRPAWAKVGNTVDFGDNNGNVIKTCKVIRITDK